jgi:hypothetical protein
LPPTPQQLAERVLGLEAGVKFDSAIAVRLQAYVDSLAEEHPMVKAPSWTTGSGAKKLGVDSKWIYLGPIKIPTMLLALLPINIQANPTQAESQKKLAAMEEDLFYAAQRSQNYADFRAAVNELRSEKAAEKEFHDNQRGGGPPEQDHR